MSAAKDGMARGKAGGKETGKHPGGRPTKFRPEHVGIVSNLAKLGCVDKKIAEILGISEQTLNTWKKEHPEFLECLKNGREIAAGNVAGALYQRAMGYEHAEEDVRVVNGKVVVTPTVKRYPPDTAAAIFYLKNRQPDLWRDKVEQQVSGELGVYDADTARRMAEQLLKRKE